jgi:hypothetical protein
MSRSTTPRGLAAAAITTTAAVAGAVLVGTAGASSAHDGHHAGHDGAHTEGRATTGRGHFVAQLRKDLRPYEDVAAAKADGFMQVGSCVAGPDGAMGFHFMSPERMGRPLDVRRPQFLLYGATADGGLELLGAEYMAVDADQDLSTDGDRPVLLGRPFDGPMEGHEPGMPVHYDLHVWTHKANPAGVFSPFNPKVSC